MEIKEVPIKSWEELGERQRPYAIYRGQANADWELSTSLERTCMLNDGGLESAKKRERRLQMSFKRHYHNYSSAAPEEDDELRWLALMQHHGAPTRLMDWTYSMLVAAYFAVEDATGEAAVWEIDARWLRASAERYLIDNGVENTSLAVHLGRVSYQDAKSRFKEIYLSNALRFVRIVLPFYKDSRLAAQQGVFACPGDVSTSFVENLESMGERGVGITKYLIPISLRRTILYQLHASNIGRFTLFPGLDGFATTLRIFDPIVWGFSATTHGGDLNEDVDVDEINAS